MAFSWDDKKASLNALKHGLTFEEAITAFDDPWSLIAPDRKHSTDVEIRQWLIGETDSGQVVVIVFTERKQGAIYRIISARPASRRERRIYAAIQRIPF